MLHSNFFEGIMKYLIFLAFLALEIHAETISLYCEIHPAHNDSDQTKSKIYLYLDKDKMTLTVSDDKNYPGKRYSSIKCKEHIDADGEWYVCKHRGSYRNKDDFKYKFTDFQSEYKINRRSLNYYEDISGLDWNIKNVDEENFSLSQEGKCSLNELKI